MLYVNELIGLYMILCGFVSKSLLSADELPNIIMCALMNDVGCSGRSANITQHKSGPTHIVIA